MLALGFFSLVIVAVVLIILGYTQGRFMHDFPHVIVAKSAASIRAPQGTAGAVGVRGPPKSGADLLRVQGLLAGEKAQPVRPNDRADPGRGAHRLLAPAQGRVLAEIGRASCRERVS